MMARDDGAPEPVLDRRLLQGESMQEDSLSESSLQGASGGRLSDRAVRYTLIAVNLAVLMSTLDSSVVNVALPLLVKALKTNFATIQWVVVVYIMVITSLLLSVSRLGDMLGKKKIFNLGLMIFTLGSLLCGLAPSAWWLVACRALQGVGAAMSQGLGMALVTEAVEPSRRGRAIGLIGGTVSVGLALGPSLGGVLIGLLGWRSIFLINVPLGILVWFMVRKHVPDFAPSEKGQRFDLPGALILLVSLGIYCLGMTHGQNIGFNHASVMVLLVAAALGVAAFLVVEKRTVQPMLDLSLFGNALFNINLLMGVVCFISLSGVFILPFYLELVLGFGPMVMGLLMMGAPLGMGLAAPLAGSLTDRFGPRIISIAGLCIMIVACVCMATLQMDTPWWGVLLRTAPFGIGIGCFQAPNNTAIMGAAPRERLGVASGLLNASRTLGQTTGIPLAGSVFIAFVAMQTQVVDRTKLDLIPPVALVDGLQKTYLVNAALMTLTLALAITAFVVSRRRAKRQNPAVGE
jgi:EmrB/QacA subfamily drug resistance transporter